MMPTESAPIQIDPMVPLCSPQNPVELAIFLSLLESEGIFYTVFNDFFGSLKVGPVIPLYNEKFILVPESQLERAQDMIRQPPDFDDPPEENGFTFFEKLRMLLEVIFFGWIIPAAGRYKGRKNA